MSAYKDALAISLREAPARIELARSLLDRGAAVVLLDEQVALRSAGESILCEVIDPYSDGVRSAERFEGLIESGRTLLSQSPLHPYLSGKRLQWIVVADYGTGTLQLWPTTERREAR